MEVEAEAATRDSKTSAPDVRKSAPLPESPADYARRSTQLANTIISGLSRLIEGQRQLADEFGLSLGRVFPRSLELLEGRNPEEVLTELFRSGPARLDEVNALFEDMIAHQLALVSALDDVALASMKHLSPEQLKEDFPDRRMNDARAWRFYKERHHELIENDNLRFQQLVGTGFVEGYAQARTQREAKAER